MPLHRIAVIAIAALVLTPAAAHATGIQKTFSSGGGGGNDVTFQGLAFAADGTLWTSAGPRRTFEHRSLVGGFLGSVGTFDFGGTQRPSQGIAIDTTDGHLYAMLGSQHGNFAVTEYDENGTALRNIGSGLFPGDFNEGNGVAVNSQTNHVYATGRSEGGKVVHFAPDGTVLRQLATGGHPTDVEVDPATGDVIVTFSDAGVVRRYDADLDNARVLAGGLAEPWGVSLAPDGNLWIGLRAAVQRRAPDGTILSTTTIPGGQVFDVEADAMGGAWVSAAAAETTYYVATDPPVASFSSNPGGNVPTGTRVDFTSTATDTDGTVVTRQWDLDGDGEFDDATGPAASRTFTTAGTYAVRHRVVDNDGAAGVRSLSIVVSAQAPSADFTVSLDGANATFTSTSTDPDGTIALTQWDLDNDGSYTDATGLTASRTYAPGVHHVRVRVTDDDGDFATRECSFTVSAPGAGIKAETASADEGTPLRFPVRLDVARSEPVYVDYETSTGLFGTLVFAPGQTLKHVVVLVPADGVDSADRTVTLTLSEPAGAPLATATAIGTVKDVDAAPRFVLDPVSVRENAGTATLTVRLDGPVTTRAISGVLTGYGAPRTVTITPPARSATVTLPIADDAVAEADEIVTLSLTHPETAPATGTLTIRDDEPSGTTVSAAPSGPTPEAAGAVNVTVSLDHARSEPTTLHWTLSGASTEHTTDWAAREGDVVVPAGQTSAVVALQTVDDDVHEGTEPWELAVGSLKIPVPLADDEPEPVPSLLSGDPAPVIKPGMPSAVMVRWSRLSEVRYYTYDVVDTSGFTLFTNSPYPQYTAIDVFHSAVSGRAVTTRATAATPRCGTDARGYAELMPAHISGYVHVNRLGGGLVAVLPFQAYRPPCQGTSTSYRPGDTFGCSALLPLTAYSQWEYTLQMRRAGTVVETRTWTGGPVAQQRVTAIQQQPKVSLSRVLTDADAEKEMTCTEKLVADGAGQTVYGGSLTGPVTVGKAARVLPGSATILTPSSGALTVSAQNTLQLPVACSSPKCSGTATVRADGGGKARMAASPPVLGKVKFRVKKGKRANVKLKLNAAGKRLLKDAPDGTLSVAVAVKAGGKTTTTRLVLRRKR